MSNAMSRHGGNVTRISPPTYTPPSPEVAALISAKREGLGVWKRDLTPSRVEAIRKQLAIAESAMAPVAPEVVKSWLAALSGLVVNAPEPSGDLLAVFFEVCGDIPDGAWTRESRIAWVRQPPRNGFPVGSRWPAPGDLHAHLSQFAQSIREEIAGLKVLLSIADATPEPEPERLTPEEIERRRKILSERKAELEAQSREEDRIRKHGNHTPAGAEGLTGLDLANALKRALPAMSGGLREVTEQRIAMLEQNAALIAMLNGEKTAENSRKDTVSDAENTGTETAVLA